ncbi:MAG: restriction endonuclease subunit S, partial [Defluviitaleaceae bacterium]|nr:restriction endonuclease subunit S [Defluviitaleaceae bacterium]
MKDENINVPEIRFKGFADEWEPQKLGAVIERIQGNDSRMDLPTLTISAGNGWLDQRERFSNNIAGKEQENYTLLSKGELAYNKGNSKLAKYGVVFELKTYEEALVPRVYHSFRSTDRSIAAFLEYMFATKILDGELAKLITSGARMDGLLNITYGAFAGVMINIPETEEQAQIGTFFRTFDNTIDLHKSKLDKLKKLKKGYLQQMFPQAGEATPKLRFEGFKSNWKEMKFGEIVKRVSTQSNADNLPKVEFEDILSGEGRLNKDITTKFDTRKGIIFKQNN